ncbi:MAG: MBL fold metallo-hydrolase [Patescibacteria group bacterium]
MIITYFGKEFFKVQVGDTVLAFNPISKDSKLKTSRFGADIALITVNHEDYNGADQVSFGEKNPLILSGPGEYETKGIFIRGIPSESSAGDGLPAPGVPRQAGKKINTIYTLSVDKMNICFLGALSSKALPAESREAIDGVDILFVPIGGEGVLSPADAYSIAVSIEPKVIIPMDYGDEAVLKKFLKEGGAEKAEPLDKFTVKQKDIEGMEGEIIVLTPSA